MRRTISLKSLALAYGLALVWIVALLGGALVLTQPMLELYVVLGIETVLVQSLITMALAVAVASLATLGIAMVVRGTAAHVPASRRPRNLPGVASNHA